MKLYEITNEIQTIFNNMDDDGELSQEAIDHLDESQQNFEQKAVNIALYIKNLETEELAMKKRLDKITKQADFLSDYLKINMIKLSINEIKSDSYFKIKLKTCPLSLDVLDEKIIPAEYWREKVITSRSIDKNMLKDVLKEGVEVPGASLQRNIKLNIK